MPVTDVLIYRELDGTVPFLEFLDGLGVRARDRVLAKLFLLGQLGHELRRPAADYIAGTDLYELRIKDYRINYRVLYFFHGQTAAVVSHGLSKEDRVPDREISLATRRMTQFKASPERHTYDEGG